MVEIITKKVGQIKFGVVSPNYIKRISKAEVITPELYDTDGYPIEKGLMDPNMGVIDPGLRCKTCGGRLKTCPGHFGHIKLSKPVLHISYIKEIYEIMQAFCSDCGRILLNAAELAQAKSQAELARSEYNVDILQSHRHNVIKKLKKRNKCLYCGAKKGAIKFERPSTFFEDETRVWPDELRARFEKILDEDLQCMGYDTTMMRPEWLVVTTLLVPPITVRPSITLENGDRSEDDLTHKLSDIVRVNQRLGENINAGAPEIIIEDLWDLLQYHVTTYFNNKVSQVPPARHRTNRELKTLTQRLSGKSGRFRNSLAGKRVNFCARSVITPDPNISLNEVGIPVSVAKEITIPETANEWNKDWLVSLIKNSPEYPGANYLISPDGRRRKITKETADALIQEMNFGWIVERHLRDGDAVLFNRQPSLHRMSMMCHLVRVLPGRTFRINPSVCFPYNADFDGDEMNLHVPQTEESRAEAYNLARVDFNLITPRYGLSIMGMTEDMLFALYVLTNGSMVLTREEASDLVIEAGIDAELTSTKYNGRDIIGMLLPEDFNFAMKDVVIKNGKLTSGTLTEKYIGPEGGVLTHALNQQYGAEKCIDILNHIQQLAFAVVRKFPYSLSLYDLRSEHVQAKINKAAANTEKMAEEIIENFKANKIISLPGKSARETMEIKLLEVLNKSRNEVGVIIEKETDKGSNLMNLIESKTGGKILNMVEICGSLGQQALRGKRITRGYEDRALPHFRQGDLGVEAHGFVKKGYKEGLDPLGYYFNCIVGRDSYIDTAMRTPKSGYLQRRLINALQDLKVNYDGTVRDSGQNIVQFAYGGDGVDVSKSNGGGIGINGKK